MAEPDFWKDGAKSKALREEMKALLAAPEEKSAEAPKPEAPKPEAPKPPEPSPAEKKIAALRRHPSFYDQRHPDHRKTMVEYRAAIAAGDTPEERQALVDGGIEAARSLFALDVPREIAVMGREIAARYDEGFSEHEADLLRHARAEGWDRKLAGDLRDYGVRLGLEIASRGTQMTDAEVADFQRKFKGKISEAQATQLVSWFKARVVGGA
jgi:hypothetical protein